MYVERNWVEGNWGAHKWSVFEKEVRTNNDTEGWHNGLNVNQGPAPSLYQLIEILHNKARDADVEKRMVLAGKTVRRERLQSRREQVELVRLWDLYNGKRMSARMLLRKIASMKESK